MTAIHRGSVMRPSAFTRSILSLLALAVFAPVTRAHAQVPAGGTSADARLRALYTAEWTWRQREMARRSDNPGEAGASEHFPRVDATSQQARLAYWTRALAALDSIPMAELSPEEAVNAQVFGTSIRALANDVRFKTYEAPFNSDTFFWTEFTPRQGFATVESYRSYLARLRDVPRYFDEQIVNMRAGLARGFTVPRVSVVGRDKTIEPYVKPDTTNPLYTPFAQMPASIPAADQAALRREAQETIRNVVVPAYVKLLAMIRGEYLPQARTNLAATSMPDGQPYYKAMIEKFTTLDLTAQQIHDIGLAEVARIQAEMEVTKQKAGFAAPWRSSSRSCERIRSSMRRRRASSSHIRRTSRRRPTGSSARRSGFCLVIVTAFVRCPTRSRRFTRVVAVDSKRA